MPTTRPAQFLQQIPASGEICGNGTEFRYERCFHANLRGFPRRNTADARNGVA